MSFKSLLAFVIFYNCIFAACSLYVPSTLPPRALSEFWFTPTAKNLSTMDPTIFMQEKSKFLNSLFSSLPISPMSYTDLKSGFLKTRSATEKPSKALTEAEKPGAWIFMPSINSQEQDIDKPENVPLKALRSILSNMIPPEVKEAIPYTDDEVDNKQIVTNSGSIITKDKILTSISKELSSLKDDMLTTAAEMQMSKPKKSFFGPYAFMKPTTPSPIQEKMDVLSKAFDALTKMETDITSTYDGSGIPSSADTNGNSQKIARSLLEALFPTESKSNQDSEDKPKRDVNEAFQSVYHNLEEDSGPDSASGSNQDGRNRMKLCHHHHHY